ncbi:SigE family RNA polymerase sigma factor [Mangrovihabitans endophyticus]|uniref:RNA polymerase sigma24 factor n=1 Tax=Mangrovihabitans endophyticus TaxID=1751298 RepID=A0A8J3C2C2_9ACTN|nr:SigE family RNA polymerase sigma factor [Mangrovihabitans endophyticus]GGL04896.1 RNA polymerase sigma24 factor [Mangrovihabitans endophyticus]
MRQDRSSVRTERDEQFHDFVAGRRAALVRTARLLTAGDTHLAEDLVQAALTKLYVSWPAFRRADNPDGYVRRVLVNVLTDERRRVWRRRERPMAQLPEQPGPARDPATGPADDALRQALRDLPPRMRAAVVFRYFHELGVEETADALGCSVGTVKSQTARALDKLRTALRPPGGAAPHGAASHSVVLRQGVSS